MRKTVTISDKGRPFIENGQLWMFRNNLASDVSEIKNGSIVDIIGEDGSYLATGFYSQFSHIVVRILTHDRKQSIDSEFFRKRIQAAIDYRKTVQPDQLNCSRLIYGEADGLPGLTVDIYNNLLVSQISCFGMEVIKEDIYQLLLTVLKENGFNVDHIYERNDIAIRDKEHLEQYKGFYLGKGQTTTVIEENGIKIKVDIENGQKTGYFLDQKNNRALVGRFSKGKRVLDCFCHTAGFALNAYKGGADSVTAVDVSATALNQAGENFRINGFDKNVSLVQDDVFDYLQKCTFGQYDLIILDPPAFTKSRRTAMKAYNGYKQINYDAMRILADGGYLCTCSCSRYMENELFEQMLKEASKEAGVYLKQICVSQQNYDHPVLWNMDETNYLKFYVFQIVRN